jgi:ATP-dependent DNA ligase
VRHGYRSDLEELQKHENESGCTAGAGEAGGRQSRRCSCFDSVGVEITVAFHFIEPCLPSPADHPPTGPDWVHEIKHDGYRLMARRDALSVGIRLLTRNGHQGGVHGFRIVARR